MDYDLMISYSHSTKKITWEIHDWFEKQGFKVWIDKNHLDTELAKEIRVGIDKSLVFVPCFSIGYEKSDWCNRELTYAYQKKKSIVPIIVEDAYSLSKESASESLKDIQFKVAGLKYFTLEGDFDTAMNSVLKAVQKYTNKTDTPQLFEKKDLGTKERKDSISVQAEQQVEKYYLYNKKCNQDPGSIQEPSRIQSIDGKENDEGSCDEEGKKDKDIVSEVGKLNLNPSAWKSKFDSLSEPEKVLFQEKASLPLKDFRSGRPALKKILDQFDNVFRIMEYFEFDRDSCMLVLLTDGGGGNAALSFLEYLKMFKAMLKIKEFCSCLEKLELEGALNILSQNKYNNEDHLSKIAYKHLRELSFELISHDPTHHSWKDVAHELDISLININNIGNSSKRPCEYSRSDKLFYLIETQYPHVTILNFLDILRKCEMLNAHDLICEKIIEKMRKNK